MVRASCYASCNCRLSACSSVRRYFFPEDWQILQEQERLDALMPGHEYKRSKTVSYNRKATVLPLANMGSASETPYTRLDD